MKKMFLKPSKTVVESLKDFYESSGYLKNYKECKWKKDRAPEYYCYYYTDEWFMQLSHKYEVERMELKAKIAEYKERLRRLFENNRNKENFICQSPIRMFLAGIRCNPTIGVAPFSLFQAVSLYSCGFALILAIRLLISSSVGMSISPIAVK